MFRFQFIQANPTTYVLHFKNGLVTREGLGLSFFWISPSATLVWVPTSSIDVPFAFEDVTIDFQEVTLQGQLTYRVIDPKKVASLLDYSVLQNGRYASQDPKKLDERLVNLTHVLASTVVHRMTLRQALVAHEAVVAEVLAGLKSSEAVAMLGLEVLTLSVLSIKPTPETAKALEAEAREALQRQADEAIYARRNAAVAQERMIRESELSTEIAVEEKKRQIRETQMAAEIAVEQQKAELLKQRVANEREEADSRAYALGATLEPLKSMDWRTLMAVNAGKMDAKTNIAMAFRDLAENANKIGELNISPDLLSALLEKGK